MIVDDYVPFRLPSYKINVRKYSLFQACTKIQVEYSDGNSGKYFQEENTNNFYLKYLGSKIKYKDELSTLTGLYSILKFDVLLEAGRR